MRKKLYAVLGILLLLFTSFTPSFSVLAEGTLNVNLSVSALSETTLSGQDALYKIDLKITGSDTSYNDSKLNVTIPDGHYLNIEETPLDTLSINNVAPSYDKNNNTLSYELGTLQSGQNYSYILRVVTQNGIEKNGSNLVLKAKFSADNLASDSISDQASTKIEASNTISISKNYVKTEKNGVETLSPAVTGDIGVWSIKVEDQKKASGLTYLKEGTKITVTDELPSGLIYKSNTSGVNPIISNNGKLLTWVFDAPTISEQESSVTNLFFKEFEIYTEFSPSENFETTSNSASVYGTDIGDSAVNSSATSTISTGISYPNIYVDPNGAILVPNNWQNPTPGPFEVGQKTDSFIPGDDGEFALYDDQIWSTQMTITTGAANSYTKDLTANEYYYYPDANANLESVVFPSYYFRAFSSEERFSNQPLTGGTRPVLKVYITINGQEYLFLDNPKDETAYPLKPFLEKSGLPQNSHVTEMHYVYTYRPAGMYGKIVMNWGFNEGTNGKVTNKMKFYTDGYSVDGHVSNITTNYIESVVGRTVWNTGNWEEEDSFGGPRSVIVIPRPVSSPPTAISTIKLEKNKNGAVVVGGNRVLGSFENTQSSSGDLKSDFSAVVLLPKEVSADTANLDFKIKNANNSEMHDGSTGGSISILDNDYQGKGIQRILVKWDDILLKPGEKLEYAFNVQIGDNVESPMEFYTFGSSGNKELVVPLINSAITDSSIFEDKEDLNGNGNTTETLIKSGNKYTVLTDTSLVVTKSVKGKLDDKFSTMGQVSPGGAIEYQVNIGQRNSSQAIENFEFIDVLPSVGDLGISDNIARNSKFTPILTGPLVLPDDWKGKVDVYYSTAKNPKRDTLFSVSDYSNGAVQYSNPTNATDPNWVLASQVSNWSAIHSYAIRLKTGTIWSSVSDFSFTFSMRAPTIDELKSSGESTILAPNVTGDPSSIKTTDRTAWNSFAYRENSLQMVEPLKVGVSMTHYTGDIYLFKYLNKNDSSTDPKIDNDYQIVSEQGLKGAEFNLLDSDGKLVGSATSDDKGRIHFSNVWYGDYTLVETKAPDGYELYKKEIKVKVSPTENNGVALAFVGDDPITKLPDAGGDGNTFLPIIIFGSFSLLGLITFGSIYLFKKKAGNE